MDYNNVAEIIISLRDRDLEMRDKLIQKGELGEGYNPEMERIHNINACVLNDIINKIGFPTIDKVGEEASEAAWLVIQHAIGQPVFMKKCALLLARAVKKKKANPINLAYLADRIAVYEGKPQLYGTQFDWDEKGCLGPYPYDDKEKLNQRRKTLGLNSLEEQMVIINKQAEKENQSAPCDLVERKRDIDHWRKKVGWID